MLQPQSTPRITPVREQELLDQMAELRKAVHDAEALNVRLVESQTEAIKGHQVRILQVEAQLAEATERHLDDRGRLNAELVEARAEAERFRLELVDHQRQLRESERHRENLRAELDQEASRRQELQRQLQEDEAVRTAATLQRMFVTLAGNLGAPATATLNLTPPGSGEVKVHNPFCIQEPH